MPGDGDDNEIKTNSANDPTGKGANRGISSTSQYINNKNSAEGRSRTRETYQSQQQQEYLKRLETALGNLDTSKNSDNKYNNEEEAKQAKALEKEIMEIRAKENRAIYNEEMLARARDRDDEKKSWQERLKDNKKANDEYLKELKEAYETGGTVNGAKVTEEDIKQAEVANAMSEAANLFGNAANQAAESFATAAKALTQSMDSFLNDYAEMYSSINARVQGAYEDMDFESLSSSIKEIVGMSPYVSYESVMKELDTLVKAGTTVNLEERAFLASVSDKIATTFDAMDSTLLRIVRLQGTDTTDARLGMEASLTRLFNYYFSDTSYLADAFDSVTSALLGLTSSLDAQAGVEYEYVIQKWLGALGSEGADTSTLTSLASAINALAIGDISSLQSNEGMQNLLIMAANRQGLDFSEMLVNTPSQQELNLLMYGVVDYIQEIMEGANNVVKNQYASLFGITYTDIQAFMNLNDEMLDQLYQESMSYSDTLTELDYQLKEVASNRTSVKEMVDNVIDNVEAGVALSMFNNQGMYMTYAIAEAVESITGGIQIPDIFAMGTGVSLANTVEEYMKIGVTGASLISSFFNGFQSWQGAEALNVENWNVNYNKGEYTGYTSTNLLTTSTSNVGTVSNSDYTGIQQSIYEEQSASAEEISGTSLSESEQTLDAIEEIRDFLIGGGDEETPLAVRQIMMREEGTRLTTLLEENESLNDILTDIRDILEERTLGNEEGEAEDLSAFVGKIPGMTIGRIGRRR